MLVVLREGEERARGDALALYEIATLIGTRLNLRMSLVDVPSSTRAWMCALALSSFENSAVPTPSCATTKSSVLTERCEPPWHRQRHRLRCFAELLVATLLLREKRQEPADFVDDFVELHCLFLRLNQRKRMLR